MASWLPKTGCHVILLLGYEDCRFIIRIGESVQLACALQPSYVRRIDAGR